MSWLRRVFETMERAAMASAYAQAGQLDFAREIMEGARDRGGEA